MRNRLIGVLLLAACMASSAEELLSPEEAFKVESNATGERSVEWTLTIAPGYSLYQDRIKVSESGEPVKAEVSGARSDEVHGSAVYRDKVTVKAKAIKGKASDLKMVSQGCADSGVCYPPVNSDGTSTKVKGTTQFCKVVPIIGKHFC